MSQLVDLVGRIFIRLLVLERAGSNKRGRALWRCRCECGNIIVCLGNHLLTGNTKSCGCLQRESVTKRNTTHGLSYSTEYKSWADMRARCDDPKNKEFKNYGGRGIKYCERWKDFENWFADMGRRPSPKHTIDRKNTNGNYEPDNCRWATQKVQANNRTNNHRITFNSETLTLSEWSHRTGIPERTLYARIVDYHWPIDRALSVLSPQSKPSRG